jgi:hypothetical protein
MPMQRGIIMRCAMRHRPSTSSSVYPHPKTQKRIKRKGSNIPIIPKRHRILFPAEADHMILRRVDMRKQQLEQLIALIPL